jgi:hypothetical protein
MRVLPAPEPVLATNPFVLIPKTVLALFATAAQNVEFKEVPLTSKVSTNPVNLLSTSPRGFPFAVGLILVFTVIVFVVIV